MKLLLPLLTVLFVGLKLTNYIDWSWWWVLSPMLAPLALAAICAIIYGILWLSIGEEGRRAYRLQQSIEDYVKALKQ